MSFKKKFYNSLRIKMDNEKTQQKDLDIKNAETSLAMNVQHSSGTGESSGYNENEKKDEEYQQEDDIKTIESVTLNDNIEADDDIEENKTILNVQTEIETSIGYPDGLVMDPLSPTTIAVTTEFMDRLGCGLSLLKEHGKKVQKYVWKNRKIDILKKSWNSVVNVVLIEARDLPNGPANGNNVLYCKFRLGAENHKSKTVKKSIRPTWRERFNLYLYEENNLELTLWHKGKQKCFMGRCHLDLSRFEKEKTHDLWQQLECGFGEVHILVTISGSVTPVIQSQVATTNGVHHLAVSEEKYAWYKFDDDWSEVGELSVTVHCAKGISATGLSGKADAFCVLELDNCRVQTHTLHGTTEPQWDKTYTFEVTDITSTLELSVYDESIISSMKDETLGKLTIPLLRINNGEKRWYALKDKSKKKIARGNCPRILLEMAVTWNPIKASLRVLSPKETKYVQKSPKFNIPLIYSNLVFIKDIFHVIYEANESLKRLFEWENREKSTVALAVWLAFWLLFRPWMLPLLFLSPFLYHCTMPRSCNNNSLTPLDPVDEDVEEDDLTSQKDDKTIKTRIYDLQDLTITIKNGIDFIVSIVERIRNLWNFTVPYLSYLAIIILIATAFAMYLIPFNFLLMALGIYKFTRKFLNPERIPNNDILDFLTRVPDNEILKQWRELKVPEPNLQRVGSIRKIRS